MDARSAAVGMRPPRGRPHSARGSRAPLSRNSPCLAGLGLEPEQLLQDCLRCLGDGLVQRSALRVHGDHRREVLHFDDPHGLGHAEFFQFEYALDADHLLMVDGHYARWLGGDVTVWVLPLDESSTAGDLVVANDNDFEAKSFLEYRLPPSAFGDYEQAQYGVLDHEGAPVDIILDWDDQDRLRITVHQDATDEELRTLFFIGTHPQA